MYSMHFAFVIFIGCLKLAANKKKLKLYLQLNSWNHHNNCNH